MSQLFTRWRHSNIAALLFKKIEKINPPRASTRPGLTYASLLNVNNHTHARTYYISKVNPPPLENTGYGPVVSSLTSTAKTTYTKGAYYCNGYWNGETYNDWNQ